NSMISAMAMANNLSSSTSSANNSWRKCCQHTSCLLCTRGTPRCLSMNHPSWTLILRVVFYSLSQIHPDKEFFNLKKEVYVYLNDHWDILSPTQAQSTNWKRQVQDALSHSRFFRSGRHTLRCNGYWQLKLLCNPWNYNNSKQFEALRFEDIHPPYSPTTSLTSSPHMSPEISWRLARGHKDDKSQDKFMNINKLLVSAMNDSDPEESFDMPSPSYLTASDSFYGNNSSCDSGVLSASTTSTSSSGTSCSRSNNNSPSILAHSISKMNCNTFNHPTNFKFLHNKKSFLQDSPISSPYLTGSHRSSGGHGSTPNSGVGSPFHLSSLRPSSPISSPSKYNNNPAAISPRAEFDEDIIITKINQMRSILNCT
ncbi:hypothetical protein SAMD00019534_077940, partial [Acytostelium subglobosum LB1]|uniref:hypothetical protein n=1 Tax=Acytostelium subglobosum LB1 TaxID=1410327 RepID=UPI0006448416